MARIAVISTMTAFPWGGSEFLWTEMVEQALIQGHEVLVSVYDWSVSHPRIIHLQKQGAFVFARPRFLKTSQITRIFQRTYHKISWISSLTSKSPYQHIFDYKPDIICVNQGSSYDAIYDSKLLNLLYSSSTPYVVVCQFNSDSYSFDETSRTAARDYFDRAACMVFVSKHNRKLAERQLAKSLVNAEIVQNPVNLSQLNIVPYPLQKKIYFASVARLDIAFKGQDLLLEALSLPQWRERDWSCSFYGVGPDQAYLEALALQYGIADRLQFVGHVNDVRAIWSENHILVMPSRAEGTPLSLVEAMVCGRPAVVTDVGGNAEWIEEAKTGFIAEASTVKSFSAALEKAWLSRNLWKEMGTEAHRSSIAKLDPSPGKTLLSLVLNAASK